MLQCADRGKIALAHAVLNRHPALEIRIVQNRPGRSLFLRDLLRIIDNSGHAPHVAGRIIGPGLPVDVLGFENVLQIRRDSVDVVIVRIRPVKKVIRERHQPVLADQLHEHIFRRADKIKGVPQSQHVVKVFVGPEGGIFNVHLDAISFLVPLLKVLDHTVLADDISARKINRLILAPVTGVNVLLPVADAKRDRLLRGSVLGRKTRYRHPRCRSHCRQQSRKHGCSSLPVSLHPFAPFSIPFPRLLVWYRFIPRTVTMTSRKITVERAHSAVLMVVWEPLVALTTYVLMVSNMAGFV